MVKLTIAALYLTAISVTAHENALSSAGYALCSFEDKGYCHSIAGDSEWFRANNLNGKQSYYLTQGDVYYREDSGSDPTPCLVEPLFTGWLFENRAQCIEKGINDFGLSFSKADQETSSLNCVSAGGYTFCEANGTLNRENMRKPFRGAAYKDVSVAKTDALDACHVLIAGSGQCD